MLIVAVITGTARAVTRYLYLVDISNLRGCIFPTPGKSGITLKQILELPSFTKVFFDTLEDSRILYGGCGIKLDGGQNIYLVRTIQNLGAINEYRVQDLLRCLEKGRCIRWMGCDS
jgi:hypothetical protein